MAKLYIGEYSNTYHDHGTGGSAAFAPVITEQTLDFTAGIQTSAAFSTNTQIIRIHTDTNCFFLIGSAPVAVSGTNARLAANQTEYFAVPPGYKISVIQ